MTKSNKQTYKVSVALASYNGERFIAEQLNSLIQQTVQPDEIIVADDSSTDGTLAIVQGFVGSSPISIDILKGQSARQLRPPANFERAVKATTGDIIFLCDQDDKWDHTKIERHINFLKNNEHIDAYLTDARFCNESLEDSGQTKLQQIRKLGMPDTSFVMGCCASLRKPLADLALPFPKEITHDGWVIGLSDLLKRTRRDPIALQDYRIHENNVSKGFAVNQLESIKKTKSYFNYLCNLTKKFNSNASLLQELNFLCAAAERIEERRDDIALHFSETPIDELLTNLQKSIEYLENRRKIRLSRPISRLNAIFNAFKTKQYIGSLGLRHAIKDLLTPMQQNESFKLWRD